MVENIFSHFKTQGTFESANPFGSGHINDTYLVKTSEANCPNYILQRINHRVFTQPQALMDNVLRVTQHVRNKLSITGNKNINRESLTVISSIDQQPIVLDDAGHYWACYLYIHDSYAHDVVKNPKQAYEGGKLIGRFLELLSDFPSATLHETLPKFHNVEFRLTNFMHALKQDAFDRVKFCRKEIEFVLTHADEMKLVMSLGKQGKIPLRVVHNDTKFNNLLLDSEDNGLCVIDLDTVMPGYIHYDFSDAVRTVANSSAEDEKELAKIQFDLNLFSAFCAGFLGALQGNLHSAEINTLAHAAPLMPYLHGTRFLTDYLSGDQYYKIHFPEHNLQRAQAQFQLVRRMQEKMQQMQRIVTKYSYPEETQLIAPEPDKLSI